MFCFPLNCYLAHFIAIYVIPVRREDVGEQNKINKREERGYPRRLRVLLSADTFQTEKGVHSLQPIKENPCLYIPKHPTSRNRQVHGFTIPPFLPNSHSRHSWLRVETPHPLIKTGDDDDDAAPTQGLCNAVIFDPISDNTHLTDAALILPIFKAVGGGQLFELPRYIWDWKRKIHDQFSFPFPSNQNIAKYTTEKDAYSYKESDEASTDSGRNAASVSL